MAGNILAGKFPGTRVEFIAWPVCIVLAQGRGRRGRGVARRVLHGDFPGIVPYWNTMGTGPVAGRSKVFYDNVPGCGPFCCLWFFCFSMV